MNLCLLKNVFGKPRTGVHKIRMVGDTAMFDYIGSLLIACVITHIFKIPLEISTILIFILSIGVHWLCCVQTNSIRWLSSF
jgi:hypothetical protein